jgi:hypothetical protein
MAMHSDLITYAMIIDLFYFTRFPFFQDFRQWEGWAEDLKA